MNYTKKNILFIIYFFSFCLLSTTSAMGHGHEKKSGAIILPVLNDDSYVAEPTLALIGGQSDVSDSGSNAETVAGIELSINCPCLKTPTNRIRQRISLSQTDQDSAELISLEFNPHYMVPVSRGLEVGFGPGIGVINATVADDDDTVLGFNLGVSVDYRRGKFFAGADLRHQITNDGDFDNNKIDFENTRATLKLGVNF